MAVLIRKTQLLACSSLVIQFEIHVNLNLSYCLLIAKLLRLVVNFRVKRDSVNGWDIRRPFEITGDETENKNLVVLGHCWRTTEIIKEGIGRFDTYENIS